MTEDYRPGSAADAETREEGGRYTLVFVRRLNHPPSKVWDALTDPDGLREWAPFDADRDLGAPGAAKLTMVGGAEDVLDSDVLVAEPPRILEYTWAGGIVRWELDETASGTRLTLRHTIDDPEWLPKTAAGWHICIDLAARALDGNPLGRIPPSETKRIGWERLNAEYAEMFGIENTGWPEELFEEDS